MNTILALFRRTTLDEEIKQELEQARRDKVSAELSLEFYKSKIAYNNARIQKLNSYVLSSNTDSSATE